MIGIDMKMPEKCGLCPLFHAEHPMHCQGVKADRKKKIVAPYGQPRPDWCPLHPLDDVIRVGDEVYWTGNPNYIGVITFVEDHRACIVFRDGKVYDVTREGTEEPFEGISKTGFVDHIIIDWVSES